MIQRLATARRGRARDLVEQDGLTAIFLGVTAIEAFTNIYIRTVAEEPQFAHARPSLLDAVSDESRMGVERKLRLLASNAFNSSIREADPRWTEFQRLLGTRNSFVHFRSSYQTVSLPGITLAGLADTSIYANLSDETPSWVLACIRGIVELVGLARGAAPEQLRGFVHGQIGLLQP